MTRRFEVGPILVALGAALLLVSLFLDWYGPLNAWEAFEVVDVLLAVLAVVAVAVLVAAELVDPPPTAGNEALEQGAWLAFAATLVMVAGAVLSVGRIRFAVAIESREVRERVAVLDHRQDTTETAAIEPAQEQRAER